MKVDKSFSIVEKAVSASKTPIVLCSFGKDSMVMLHLIRKVREDIPVLFFKEAFHPRKYIFANRIIAEWNLTVYEYPPTAMEIMNNNGVTEIINLYSLGFGAYLYLPTGIVQKQAHDSPFICALRDVYHKPKVDNFYYQWDLTFIGHKDSDKDVILENAKPQDGYRQAGLTYFVYPLKDWTDADIWEYMEKNNIPYNDKRYDKANGYKEFEDYTFNNDYHECCYNCINFDEPDITFCHLENKSVLNISRTMNFKEKIYHYERLAEVK